MLDSLVVVEINEESGSELDAFVMLLHSWRASGMSSVTDRP